MLTDLQRLELTYMRYMEALDDLLREGSAENLRQIRLAHGIQSQVLAAKMHLEKAGYSVYETNRTPVNPIHIGRFIKAVKECANQNHTKHLL